MAKHGRQAPAYGPFLAVDTQGETGWITFRRKAGRISDRYVHKTSSRRPSCKETLELMIPHKAGLRPSTSIMPAHGTATCAGHALAAEGRGLLDGSVHAVGEEAEIAGAPARIDDIEHFLRRALERDRVLVRRHEVGRVVAVRVQPDALIGLVRRSDFRTELVAQL